jgi:hypothetical protein
MWLQPQGYSLATAAAIPAAETVVTGQAFPGAQGYLLPDVFPVGGTLTISNFSPGGTDMLVFSRLPINGGGAPYALGANNSVAFIKVGDIGSPALGSWRV